MTSKTYWREIFIGSDNAKQTCKSWFSPLADDMTPYKAEILCDRQTDREKKLRAFMTDADGSKHQFERTTGRSFSISVKRIAP